VSYATHCIPFDEDCSVCNPGRDLGPSVQQLERMVETGECCQDCFCQFTREHGEKVSCNHCVNQRVEMEVKEAVVRARHPEATREAFRQRANKRKESKSNG
jgi:hypothetical protein